MIVILFKLRKKFLIARKNPFKYILIDLLRRRTQIYIINILISDILLILLNRICRAVLNLNIGTQKGRLWISHLNVAHSISWYILIDFRFQLFCSLCQWVCQFFLWKKKSLKLNTWAIIVNIQYFTRYIEPLTLPGERFLYAPRALNCTEILGNF